MHTFPLIRPLLRDVLRVDRTKILVIPALRSAAGVATPLALGTVTGHTLAGVTACTGALQVAFSDKPGLYRVRAARMLLAGLWSAASVLVGSATGAIAAPAVALAALWGFGGGMLVALGVAAADVGMAGIVLLLVFAGQPLTPAGAVNAAALVMAGAVFQTMLAVAAWPVQPLGPQRMALAAVLRQLAASAGAIRSP